MSTFRLFQAVAALAIALSVVARRAPCLAASLFAGLAVVAAVLGWRSYRWIGHRELILDRDSFLVGERGTVVHAHDVRIWAIGEGEVRVYPDDGRFVWRFFADAAERESLRMNLTKLCGQPWLIVRRGSRGARAVAAAMALAAAGACGVALAANAMAVGLLSMLVAPMALSAYLFLSQKTLRGQVTPTR